jgi:hypothetical protein
MTKPSSGTLFTIESCNFHRFDMTSTMLKEGNQWSLEILTKRGALYDAAGGI